MSPFTLTSPKRFRQSQKKFIKQFDWVEKKNKQTNKSGKRNLTEPFGWGKK